MKAANEDEFSSDSDSDSFILSPCKKKERKRKNILSGSSNDENENIIESFVIDSGDMSDGEIVFDKMDKDLQLSNTIQSIIDLESSDISEGETGFLVLMKGSKIDEVKKELEAMNLGSPVLQQYNEECSEDADIYMAEHSHVKRRTSCNEFEPTVDGRRRIHFKNTMVQDVESSDDTDNIFEDAINELKSENQYTIGQNEKGSSIYLDYPIVQNNEVHSEGNREIKISENQWFKPILQESAKPRHAEAAVLVSTTREYFNGHNIHSERTDTPNFVVQQPQMSQSDNQMLRACHNESITSSSLSGCINQMTESNLSNVTDSDSKPEELIDYEAKNRRDPVRRKVGNLWDNILKPFKGSLQ